MHQPLWMALQAQQTEIELLLSEPERGTLLKARFPHPRRAEGLRLLLEALVAWHGRPIVAALDADAEEVQRQKARWAVLLGDLDGLDVSVRWVQTARPGRDRFFDGVGDFASARKLIRFGAGGQ